MGNLQNSSSNKQLNQNQYLSQNSIPSLNSKQNLQLKAQNSHKHKKQKQIKKKHSVFSENDKQQASTPKKNTIKFWKTQTQDDSSKLSSYTKLSQKIQKKCQCSWKTRIIGYIICCIFGWVISTVSSITFVIRHDPVDFCVFYSVGQICSITGSCFLSTPIQQLRQMAKQTRIILSVLYVGSTIGTICAAIFLPDNLKALIFIPIVIQIVSYFLYTFSFLPFGRAIIKKVFRVVILQ